ncbi:HdeD family acid-resistance protein [Rhodospira trueperi]|uniref:Uncharacterized membrane protein HdeD, DUF308 family n=1 Tax=Rhodospira trueperi TaxID=69960 RepID=A0A1G7DA25_9PROT|nr:DUF308 domain-containing protein [Rhodospira trueperi]SDE48412.1 Uncharacterized membrane protein HdeD, DUF308 family [Rhodospira trueperi]
MAHSMTSTADEPTFHGEPEERVWGVDQGDLTRIGVVSLLAGAAALFLPWLATTAVEWFLGLSLIVLGGFELMHALPFNRERGSVWHLILGVIAGGAGLMFLVEPLAGTLTLTKLVGLLLTASGLAKAAFSFSVRLLQGWAWALGSGLLSLGVGLAILFTIPVLSKTLLGVLVAAELLINGGWMLKLGLARERT